MTEVYTKFIVHRHTPPRCKYPFHSGRLFGCEIPEFRFHSPANLFGLLAVLPLTFSNNSIVHVTLFGQETTKLGQANT